MGASERRKGARGETEAVRALYALGVNAYRMSPLEAGGAAHGDLQLADGRVAQVKRRKALTVARWLEGADLLLMREDGGGWLVAQRLEEWARERGAVAGPEGRAGAAAAGSDGVGEPGPG